MTFTQYIQGSVLLDRGFATHRHFPSASQKRLRGCFEPAGEGSVPCSETPLSEHDRNHGCGLGPGLAGRGGRPPPQLGRDGPAVAMETAARGAAAALRMRPPLRRASGRPEASAERDAEEEAVMERYGEAALNTVPVADFRQ